MSGQKSMEQALNPLTRFAELETLLPLDHLPGAQADVFPCIQFRRQRFPIQNPVSATDHGPRQP